MRGKGDFEIQRQNAHLGSNAADSNMVPFIEKSMKRPIMTIIFCNRQVSFCPQHLNPRPPRTPPKKGENRKNGTPKRNKNTDPK